MKYILKLIFWNSQSKIQILNGYTVVTDYSMPIAAAKKYLFNQIGHQKAEILIV